jgi:tetratricopeptide (TPR) repeat protein
MKKKFAAATIIAAALALAGLAAFSSSPASLYNRGNQLYKAGKFIDAADSYRQAVTAGANNAELFYNLGNAELRSGRLGPAVASYLRAGRLDPRDPDLRANLDYARSRIKTKLPELEAGPLTRAFNFLVGLVSANEAIAALAALYWLIAAALLVLILADGERLRRAARLGLYVAVVLFVLFLPFAAVRVKRDLLTSRAVIVAAVQTARSGPGETNATLFELSEGMEVTVGTCENGWCRVSAGGGFLGWVPAGSFEEIRSAAVGSGMESARQIMR